MKLEKSVDYYNKRTLTTPPPQPMHAPRLAVWIS